MFSRSLHPLNRCLLTADVVGEILPETPLFIHAINVRHILLCFSDIIPISLFARSPCLKPTSSEKLNYSNT